MIKLRVINLKINVKNKKIKPTIQTPVGFRFTGDNFNNEKVRPILPGGGNDIIPNINTAIFGGQAFLVVLIG